MTALLEETPPVPETQTQDGGAKKPPKRPAINATGDDHDNEDREDRRAAQRRGREQRNAAHEMTSSDMWRELMGDDA
jgi:hypothetical protein